MKISRKLLVGTLSLTLFQLLPLLGATTTTQAAEITTTYTACYFRNGAGETWQWGLQSNDAWYEMAGTWETRRHTGTTYFSPSRTDRNAILQSCQNSKEYYGVAGDLIGVYAADSAAGNNYEIRINSSSQVDGLEVMP